MTPASNSEPPNQPLKAPQWRTWVGLGGDRTPSTDDPEDIVARAQKSGNFKHL